LWFFGSRKCCLVFGYSGMREEGETLFFQVKFPFTREVKRSLRVR